MDPVLSEAFALAKKHAHPVVTEAHVLAILLQHPTCLRDLLGRKLNYTKLVDWIEARLGAEPVRTGYRDGSMEPEIPAALHELFAPGLLRILGVKYRLRMRLFDEIIARNQLTTLVWDEAPIRAFYDAATRAMAFFGRTVLRYEHAFAALAAGEGDGGRFVASLAVLGYGAAADVLRSWPARNRGRLLPRLRDSVRYAAACATNYHRHELRVEDVVCSIIQRQASVRIFGELQIPIEELVFAYAHRIPRPPIADITGAVDVVVHDDDFTAWNQFRDAMTDCFEFSEPEALKLLRSVDPQGRVTFPMSDGRRAAAAIERCRVKVPTLRFELR